MKLCTLQFMHPLLKRKETEVLLAIFHISGVMG